MSQDAKLWIVRIPGPDDIYAAPSHKVAMLIKASHEKAMTEWLAKQHANQQMLYVTADDVLAVVEEFDDADIHAEMLKEFKYEDFGIAESDLADAQDDSQITLFNQGDAA